MGSSSRTMSVCDSHQRHLHGVRSRSGDLDDITPPGRCPWLWYLNNLIRRTQSGLLSILEVEGKSIRPCCIICTVRAAGLNSDRIEGITD